MTIWEFSWELKIPEGNAEASLRYVLNKRLPVWVYILGLYHPLPLQEYEIDSEELTLKQLVDKYQEQFPLPVRVCKGFYGSSDRTSVSEGDAFNIHFVKRSKVPYWEEGVIWEGLPQFCAVAKGNSLSCITKCFNQENSFLCLPMEVNVDVYSQKANDLVLVLLYTSIRSVTWLKQYELPT